MKLQLVEIEVKLMNTISVIVEPNHSMASSNTKDNNSLSPR
jgi:hypothetical protein